MGEKLDDSIDEKKTPLRLWAGAGFLFSLASTLVSDFRSGSRTSE